MSVVAADESLEVQWSSSFMDLSIRRGTAVATMETSRASQLKLKGTHADATEDFQSLVTMMDVLTYPLGVFVNVSCADTHAETLPEAAKGRVMCFAVWLEADEVKIIRQS